MAKKTALELAVDARTLATKRYAGAPEAAREYEQAIAHELQKRGNPDIRPSLAELDKAQQQAPTLGQKTGQTL